jgi:hypothetical protein
MILVVPFSIASEIIFEPETSFSEVNLTCRVDTASTTLVFASKIAGLM